MPLIHFLWAKAVLAYLSTALLVALRSLSPFQQTQFVQVFSLKPAPCYKLFSGLSRANKSTASLSLPVLASCFLLRFSFYLKLSGRSSRNFLLSSSVLSGYYGCQDTRFSRVTTRLLSWPDGERCLCPL